MPAKVFVVPDTNVFRGDPLMHGHKFRVLLGEHDRGAKVLAIPEAVLRELPLQFREQLESAASKVKKGANTLRDLGIDLGKLPIPATQLASGQYEQRLREELAARNVQIEPIPDRKVEEFFDAANARRRPFGLEGKGSRMRSSGGRSWTLPNRAK